MPDTIIPLADERFYALAQPFVLDGRPVSTHPAWARGFSQYNSYLVVDADQALLVDTGMAVHRAGILAGLDALLDPSITLSLLALRMSDFSSLGNASAIADRFDVGCIMSTVGSQSPEELHKWLDIAGSWREPTGSGRLAATGRRNLYGRREVPLGPRDSASGRVLEIVRQQLQFIPTTWLYDRATATMITSDVMTHVWRDSEDGPWVVDEVEALPTPAQVGDYLLGTRFWWLAGADVEPLREDLAAIHAAHEIECIAPAFGCILRGRAVVDHHLALMDAALVDLSRREPIGPTIVPSHLEAS